MLGNFAKAASRFASDNAPVILTAIGVTGTVTTAVLAGRASYQAALILQAEEDERQKFDFPAMEPKEKLSLVWDLYIPAGVTGVLTVSAIVMSAYVGHRRAAALAAAYALSERAFVEYKDKVVETIGKNRELNVRDTIAQDRINRNPVGKTEVVITGGGEVLCYDMYTGRYFRSSVETLKRAQNDVNHEVINGYYASLSDFYDRVGLARTKFSDEVGWNVDNLLEIHFSTTMSDDDQPCIAIDFSVAPIRNYNRIH